MLTFEHTLKGSTGCASHEVYGKKIDGWDHQGYFYNITCLLIRKSTMSKDEAIQKILDGAGWEALDDIANLVNRSAMVHSARCRAARRQMAPCFGPGSIRTLAVGRKAHASCTTPSFLFSDFNAAMWRTPLKSGLCDRRDYQAQRQGNH
jgi:hypothetical protein